MTAGKRDARYRIAAAVRSAIEAGEYPPGTRVPGEKELAEQYGVSKMTARAALDLLKIEGLIVARRGSGTHVRESRPIHRRALQRLSATVWQAGQSLWDVETGGRTFTVDQLEIGQETPTEDVARVLGVPLSGRVLVRSRRYVLDGRPVLLSTSYLPVDLGAEAGVDRPDTGPGGIYGRLADIGLPPVRFVETLRSRMPAPSEVAQLDLAPGTPVIHMRRTAYTTDDRVVEFNEMVLAGDAYILEYEVQAGRPEASADQTSPRSTR